MVDELSPRLKMFPAANIAKFRKTLGPPDPAPWPHIDGCLIALCTARSGSTLLCRQLETLFALGQMGENLNPPKLKKRTAQEVVDALKGPWFALKCSATGLLCAEATGFIDAYLHKTAFVRLVRRDIIAQAVSHARASQTGQWHSHNKPSQEPVYDANRIADSVRSLSFWVEQLRHYAEGTGRPHTLLVYEDIAAGLSAARAAGDLLGLPKRPEDDDELFRPIEKMGDAINDEWTDRFVREMDSSVGKVVEGYMAAIELGAAPRWAATDNVPHHKVRKNEMRRESQFDAVLARFPEALGSLAWAAVDALRSSFPTGNCIVIDDDDKDRLTIRFGARRGGPNAIFTLKASSGKVTIFFEGDNQITDAGAILREKNGRRYLNVKDPSDFAGNAVSDLLRQAVSGAHTPLAESGHGRIFIQSEIKKKKQHKRANTGGP